MKHCKECEAELYHCDICGIRQDFESLSVTCIGMKSYTCCHDCDWKCGLENNLEWHPKDNQNTRFNEPLRNTASCEVCNRIDIPITMLSSMGWHNICGHFWCVGEFRERRKAYEGVRA